MLLNVYEVVHNSLGICFWELPALLVAVIMVIVVVVHSRNQKKREDDFEEQKNEKLEALRSEVSEGTVKA